MDTSIYTGPVLQLLPHTVNVWVDVSLSKKIKKTFNYELHSNCNI